MRMMKGIVLAILLLGLNGCGGGCDSPGSDRAPREPRQRVIVSTDIGGTDPGATV